jgi:hypothetical protein
MKPNPLIMDRPKPFDSMTGEPNKTFHYDIQKYRITKLEKKNKKLKEKYNLIVMLTNKIIKLQEENDKLKQ